MKKWAVRIIGINDARDSVLDYVWGLYENKKRAESWACFYNSIIRENGDVSRGTTAYVVTIEYPANAPAETELKERMANYE